GDAFRNRDAPHGHPAGDRVIVLARPNRAGSGRDGRCTYEVVGPCMSDLSKGKAETGAGGPRPGHGQDAGDRRGLLALAPLALAAGAVTGLVGAVFRLALGRADQFRDALVAWAHPWGIAGLLLVTAACALATAAAAWMVRRLAPHASGSGIPH